MEHEQEVEEEMDPGYDESQLEQDQRYCEHIWLKTYHKAMLAIGRGCKNSDFAASWADDCLREFGIRFPRPTVKAAEQMRSLQKIEEEHKESPGV